NFSGTVKKSWISLSEFKPYKFCNTSKLDSLILLLTRESERFSTELFGKSLYNSLHFNSKLNKKALSFNLEFLESGTKLVENKRTPQGVFTFSLASEREATEKAPTDPRFILNLNSLNIFMC